jgi:hypothetical protein
LRFSQLRYNAVYVENQLMFQRKITPPSSWLNKPSKISSVKQVGSRVIAWLEILGNIGSRREME